MAQVLLISEETLKENSVVSANVDPKIFRSAISDAQDMYLLPILGTNLYNDVVTSVSGFVVSGTPISQPYQVLLDTYIRPTLVKYSLFRMVITLSYKFQNKNIGVKSSEFSQQASYADLTKLKEQSLDDAEVYAERLTRFLLANNATYPKYLNQENANIATVFPNKNNYTNGMFLGEDCDCDSIPARIKYQGNTFRC
jgi:hypothetical protein